MNDSGKIVRSFFYTIGSGYAARIGSLIFTFLLKNELGPEVFAITIKGLIVFILLSGLRDFGWLHSLLHFQDRVDEFVQTHFVLNLVISLSVCALTWLVAGVLYFRDPQHFAWPALVICTCSILYFIRCLTQTSEALLRKDFEFGRLGLFHGLATMAALVSSVGVAWMGWGRWSLLLGGWTTYSVFSVVYTLSYSTAVWISRPVKIRPLHIDWNWAKRLLHYGKWFCLAWGVLLNFIWNCDKLWLSVVDERSLGLYEQAWWLMQLPTAIVTHIVFSYTNTLYSRYQRDRVQLSLLFSRMMAIIVRGSSLVALLLIVSAYEITALLKAEWSAAAVMMVWLGAYAFLRPLFDDGIGLLWAVGDTKKTAFIMGGQALLAAVLVPVLWSAYGIQGLCYAMAIVAGAGVCGVAKGVRDYVDLAWRNILFAPFLALVVAALAALAYGHFAPSDWLWPNLVLRGICVTLAYGGILWIAEYRTLLRDWKHLRRIMREGG